MKRKRLLSALLSAVLLAGLMVLPAGAANTVASVGEAAQVVSALGIMVGDESGDLQLSKQVTRAEFITMVVNASGAGDQVGQASSSPYPDVPKSHWAAGYVEAAVKAGLITGYLDGTFRPSNPITLAEGATIVLKLLGYAPGDFSGDYPSGQMATYRNLKLDRGITAQSNTAVLTRQDTMYLFYNLLSTNTKQGQPYVNSLGYSLNAAGEVDRVALINSVMEGPVAATGDWQSSIPFSLTNAKVYRSGVASTLSAIQTNDVVYWCKPMRTLWVYTDRVTGAIQELTPSSSNPTAVTVAGRSYPIETSTAAYDLSDLGGHRLGDIVTLLLGRDGGVAAVSATTDSVTQTNKLGIVTSLNKGSYSGTGGSSYTADTVTIQATDGKIYSYQWNTEYFKVGNLAQVTTNSDGTVSLKRVNDKSLTGRVSSDGGKLGSYPFAEDVEIIDTYEGTALRVYASRLSGMSMTSEMVRYYVLNAAGEITRLVLKDATGDMHQYGILSNIKDSSSDLSVMVTYTLDIGGQSAPLTSTTKFGVNTGPVQIKGSLSAPDKMTSLTSVYINSISGNTISSGDVTYRMSDTVVVYEYRDNKYYLSSIDRVKDGDFSMTAWYDKSEGSGGRIRVIVAK